MTHVHEYAIRPSARPGMPACGRDVLGAERVIGAYDDKSKVDCPGCRALLDTPATSLPGSRG